MIETFILVMGLILTGIFMKRSGIFPENTSDVLNSFVLNVSLPAIIVVSIPKLTLSADLIYPVLMHWGLYFTHLILILMISKVLNFSKTVTGCLAIVTCLGNTAFLGIPMVSGFFGEKAIAYAVLYDQLGSGLAFLFALVVLIPKFVPGKEQNLKQALFNLIKFPPFVALILGFCLMKFPLHHTLLRFVTDLSVTLIPCAMVAVGFQMKFKMAMHDIKPILVGLIMKLLFVPLVALGIYSILNKDFLSLKVSVLQSGMPPMVTAGALAMSVDLEKEISAALVGYGLLISFLTLPLLKFFI